MQVRVQQPVRVCMAALLVPWKWDRMYLAGLSGIMEPEPHRGIRGGLRQLENNGMQKLQAIRLSILPVSRLLIRLLYRVLILLQPAALSA